MGGWDVGDFLWFVDGRPWCHHASYGQSAWRVQGSYRCILPTRHRHFNACAVSQDKTVLARSPVRRSWECEDEPLGDGLAIVCRVSWVWQGRDFGSYSWLEGFRNNVHARYTRPTL